jgi:hypothetical protein
MEYYTGVGSRETPDEIIPIMQTLAQMLRNKGMVCRTGGADGADHAFLRGALSTGKNLSLEIFLPWASFNGWDDVSSPTRPSRTRFSSLYVQDKPQPEAFSLAAKYHPRWKYLSNGARCLHARNGHQVLGRDVTKPELSSYVLCWTKNGKGGGGTGQAIRVAKGHGVPVYDLGDELTLSTIYDTLGL